MKKSKKYVMMLMLIGLFLSHQMFGQETDRIEAIMAILGVNCVEDVSQEDVEHFEELSHHPVEVNLASSAKMTASRIFTSFQIASIIDYRSRNGDLLSYAELASLDGFNEEIVGHMKDYVSLKGKAPPGKSSLSKPLVKNQLTLRTSFRMEAGSALSSKIPVEDDFSYGMKYRLTVGDLVEFGVAADRPIGAKSSLPSRGSVFLSASGKRNLGRLIIGDYNLRFGQGLALWTGFSTSSIYYPEAFYRRAAGLSPSLSFSGAGSNRGVAADFTFGRFTLTAALGVDGLREIMLGKRGVEVGFCPALNLTWLEKRVQGGVTLTSNTVSSDIRCNFRKFDIFSEIALEYREKNKLVLGYNKNVNLVPKMILGSCFKPGGNSSLGLRARYMKNEYGLSAGGEFALGKRINLAGKGGFGSSVVRHSGTFCLDGAYFSEPKYKGEKSDFQIKAQLDYRCQITSSLAMLLRFAERFRSSGVRERTQLRADLRWSNGAWCVNSRVDMVHCPSGATGQVQGSSGAYGTAQGSSYASYLYYAMVLYSEGGYCADRFSVWIRASAFRVDSWDARIYVYERDAPGAFNVPAYYGRGVAASVVCSAKLCRWCRLYLRFGTTQYPWQQVSGKMKPSRTDFKLQIVFSV